MGPAAEHLRYLPRIDIRPATPDDAPAVLRLLASAMGRTDDRRFADLLEWKHRANPFGESAAWVAVEGGAVIGYRAFLRWEFDEAGNVRRAVRAVDTATDPGHQGRGVFRALTLHGLDALRLEGVDFVFNTPNDRSRPGYLSMGWQVVGALGAWVRPVGLAGALALPSARAPASHWGEACTVGRPTEEALADDAAVEGALASAITDPGALRTRRSPEWLRWRHDTRLLGSRVVGLGRDPQEGFACFRLRRRGRALEATVGDVVVPAGEQRARRRLLRSIGRATGASYLLALGEGYGSGMVRAPGAGPTLTYRGLGSLDAPPLERWRLSMGDIELL